MTDTKGDLMDMKKVEAFGGQMLSVLNGTAQAFLICLGHELRLFDTMADLPASTSEEVAKATGLDERYIREWLNGLVASRIVEYDPASATYVLPPEHAAMLTRAAGPDNFAVFTQYLPLMGAVTPKIIEAFRTGSGVAYADYPRFQELQALESGPLYDAALVERIVPLADGLAGRLEAGIDVLEFGCGAGHALNVLAQAYPRSRFTGLDLSDEGVGLGRAEAAQLGLTNVSFTVADVRTAGGSYDLITAFDVVHDLAFPNEVLGAVARALRDDGVFLIMDMDSSSAVENNIEHPLGPTLYFFSVFHCMSVSLAQGGAGLGTAWGREVATSMIKDAGFKTVDVHNLEGDFMHAFYVARKK